MSELPLYLAHKRFFSTHAQSIRLQGYLTHRLFFEELLVSFVQEYLAHKKTPPPLEPP